MKKYLILLAMACMALATGCGSDDDNKEPYVIPEPETTTTVVLAETPDADYEITYGYNAIYYSFRIGWEEAGNLFITNQTSSKTMKEVQNKEELTITYTWWTNSQIIDMGEMASADDITEIPRGGWQNGSVPCVAGHGYLVRLFPGEYYRRILPDGKDELLGDSWSGKTMYVRIYVIKETTNDSGDPAAEVEIQYPVLMEDER